MSFILAGLAIYLVGAVVSAVQYHRVVRGTGIATIVMLCTAVFWPYTIFER